MVRMEPISVFQDPYHLLYHQEELYQYRLILIVIMLARKTLKNFMGLSYFKSMALSLIVVRYLFKQHVSQVPAVVTNPTIY